jgi:hypothetical protein
MREHKGKPNQRIPQPTVPGGDDPIEFSFGYLDCGENSKLFDDRMSRVDTRPCKPRVTCYAALTAQGAPSVRPAREPAKQTCRSRRMHAGPAHPVI